MKKNNIDLTEISKKLEGIKWMLLYNADSIELESIDKFNEIDINNKKLIEAHLFGEDKEIYIFEYDGIRKAVLTDDLIDRIDRIDGDVVKREHELIKKYKTGENILVTKEYIFYDEDGMAYVGYTRPANIIKGEN